MSRWTLRAIAIACIGVGLWWFVPRHKERMVTLDGEHSFSGDAVPTTRQVIWMPAKRVEPLGAKAGARDSLIRPAIDEDETVLYYTLRKSTGGADIYRSRRVDDEWSPAEPVTELNTDADDIGPVIQNGGKTLYLYSDREGSYGGFDIYVSHRTDDGWSKPENLGPKINSPAHEYDPAITHDGERLFFASNRSARMHRLLLENELGDPREHWTTTVRADLGLNKFDLYQAKRGGEDTDWKIAKPLDAVNLAEANEGAPFVDPVGAFVYFVSDRPARDGEEANFDIYRSRIQKSTVGEPVSLGSGVNTAANEIEPALSAEGFRLFFSRNLKTADTDSPDDFEDKYGLFASAANEVEFVAEWDTSNWSALIAFVSENWTWLLLALLVAALIASLVWFFRRMTVKRATVPSFFLLALMLHLFMAMTAFLVVFDPVILATVKKAMDGFTASEDRSGSHQSHKAGDKSWEKLGDIPTREATDVPEVERQVVDAPNVPVPSDQKFVNVPLRFDPSAPKIRIQEDLPKPTPPQKSEPLLTRNSRLQKVLNQQAVQIDDIKPVEEQKLEDRPREAVELAKNEPPPINAQPKMLRRTPRPIEFETDLIEPDSANEPVVDSKVADAKLARSAAAKPIADIPPVQIEQITKTDTPNNTMRDRPDVDITKSSPVKTPDQLPIPRRNRRQNPLELAKADFKIESIDEPAPIKPVDAKQAIERASKEVSALNDDVKIEQVNTVDSQPTMQTPVAQDVNVDKSAPTMKALNSPLLKRKSRTNRTIAAVEIPLDSNPTEDVTKINQKPATKVTLDRSIAKTDRPDPLKLNIDEIKPVIQSQPSDAPRPIDIKIDRTNAAPLDNAFASLPRRSIREAIKQFAESKVERETNVDAQLENATDAAQKVDLNRHSKVEVGPSDVQKLIVEDIKTSSSPDADLTPLAPNVDVERQNDVPNIPANATAMLGRRSITKALELEKLDIPTATNTGDDAPTAKSDSNADADLARNSAAVQSLVNERVEITGVTTTDNAAAARELAKADVSFDKQVTGQLSALNSLSRTRRRQNSLLAKIDTELIKPVGGDISVDRTNKGSAKANLNRATNHTLAPAESDVVTVDAIKAVDGPTGTGQVQSAEFTVDRTSGQAGVKLAGLVQTGTPSSLSGRSVRRLNAGQRAFAANSQPFGIGPIAKAKLDRTNPTETPISEDTIATDMQLKAVAGTQSEARNSFEVDLNKLAANSPAVPFKTEGKLSGPFQSRRRKLVLGSLSDRNVELALAPSPFRSQLLERNARAPLLLYAQDNIGLQAMLQLRRVTEEAKKDLIKAFGGKEDALKAVRRGIAWLATQQHENGSWSLTKFRKIDGKLPNGAGNVNSEVAATGFALLPFLGDGNTHQEGRYQELVQKGLDFLVQGQKPDGELTTGKEGNGRMYSHGIATIALCEAYAMTRDANLKAAAQNAINFIVKSQHKSSGGWRYHPNQPGDTSVVGWQVMALKSGQMAELQVPKETLDGVKKWFQKVGGTGGNLGRFGYTAHDFKPAMSAEAMLCLQYLDAERNDPRLVAGADRLLNNLPQKGRESSYYLYYGTQVMYHMQGQYWQKWNIAMSNLLLGSQHKDGHLAGTWDPTDQWEKSGGRIMSTSLRVLMLEAYFRHLPLYHVTELQ